jgi:glycosyltransferase involved in cell wall biosynthesis
MDPLDYTQVGLHDANSTHPDGVEEGVKPRSLTVCLVTEGGYPHYPGGVSTWCDMLVRGLPEVRFVLVSLVANPGVQPMFHLPPNVTQLFTVPLWGTGEALEIHRNLGLLELAKRKRSAPTSVIEQEFIPLFQHFMRLIWTQQAQPAVLGQLLGEMAGYFRRHDFDTTMRSHAVWQCFLQESTRGYQQLGNLLGMKEPATLLGATDSVRLLYRWLTVLTIPIPPVDVVHAAAAGLCSIPAIVARQEHGTSFLLTEHGVYLRERLLALARGEGGMFEHVFHARFVQRLTEASYFHADQIAPGSNFNHRWELENGAEPARIQTIYNGPDPAEFTPAGDHKPADAPPTVVWLGRIDPLKDLETLIRAAHIVRQEMPAARFVLYGKAPRGNEWYYEQCVALRDALGLKQSVIFGGFAASAEAAYNEGDFVVLSSISEGFPYSVVEAMMCGRAVVGTDVGGVSEALEGCGLVVEPRNPTAMAEACLTLLRNPELSRRLGRQARAKALERFSLQQCNAAYLASFQRLATHSRNRIALPQPAAVKAPTGLWQRLSRRLAAGWAAQGGGQ